MYNHFLFKGCGIESINHLHIREMSQLRKYIIWLSHSEPIPY